MKEKKRELLKFLIQPKSILIELLILITLAGLIVSVYYLWIFSFSCGDQTCFSNAIVDCKRSYYIDENEESIMSYHILGRDGQMCETKVVLTKIKGGTVELESLEGKSMICETDLGVYVQPESDIKNCHGELREEIQEIIIQRMHSQIIENIGQVSQEATSVI